MSWMSRTFNQLPLFSAVVVSCFENDRYAEDSCNFQDNLLNAKRKCAAAVTRKMHEVGAPGMIVAVSVDGKTMWSEGFGYADVENELACRPSTVMRVASLSKPLTAFAVAKLWEDGKLDLDKSIKDYVPEFPEKTYDGKQVNITLRLLLSHLAGIRHYDKRKPSDKDPQQLDDAGIVSCKKKSRAEDVDEFQFAEYHSTKKYSSVTEALSMFKEDDLLNVPGGKYLYTTHGYTLISAALEQASGREFLSLMQDHFRRIGMFSTVPDQPEKLIPGRARYYVRNEKGKLENAPYVDLSYKWAGGGFLSTVTDLIKFGDAMIYSYQVPSDAPEHKLKGILRRDTVRQMWTAIATPERKRNSARPENERYGMGWDVYPTPVPFGCCHVWEFEVGHTGGAIGASSVLLLLPDELPADLPSSGEQTPPDCDTKESLSCVQPHCEVRGVSVAIITNLQAVSLSSLARTIAYEFKRVCRSDYRSS